MILHFTREHAAIQQLERRKKRESRVRALIFSRTIPTCRKQRIDLTSILQRATSSSNVDTADMDGRDSREKGGRRCEKQRQQTGVIKRGRVFGREKVAQVKAETWHGLTFLSAPRSLRVPGPRWFLDVYSRQCNIPAGDIAAGDLIRLISSGAR